MFVKIGSLEIEEVALTVVGILGFGERGFEFRGVAPEEKGKRIVETLSSLKGQKGIECEAEALNHHRVGPGYGCLEQFEIEVYDRTAPVVYRFSGVVKLF
jgi:hypothetical protein